MSRPRNIALLLALLGACKAHGEGQGKPAEPAQAGTDECVACHQSVTPSIVSDWKLSKHSQGNVSCDACHGSDHRTKDDVAKVKLPTPDTCGQCHAQREEQFKRSKHAFAWAAMKAMPTFHYQPMALMEGQKGCGGCHKIGLKSEAEMRDLKKAGGGFGVARATPATRGISSPPRRPASPRPVRPATWASTIPSGRCTVQAACGALKPTGHTRVPQPDLSDVPHAGRRPQRLTAWGFLAVRLPLPEDKQWAADQVTILQGLGVLDPAGKPTGRLDVVKAAQVARLTQEEFDASRKKMVDTCHQCHSVNFVGTQFRNAEGLLREADHLMAEGIRTVAALYKDGVLRKPKDYAHAFPDLLTFHDAPTVPEQKLFVMFLEHRMRTFQGAFHNNPDYSLWYGWSEMVRDLAEIKEAAATLREKAGKKAAAKPAEQKAPKKP
jgi:hypothetical protein